MRCMYTTLPSPSNNATPGAALGGVVTTGISSAGCGVAGGEGDVSEEFEEAVVSDWFEVGQCQS